MCCDQLTLTCNENSVFTQPTFECIPGCSIPDTVRNTRISRFSTGKKGTYTKQRTPFYNQHYDIGDKIYYRCTAGKQWMDGNIVLEDNPVTATCDEFGNWNYTGLEFSCETRPSLLRRFVRAIGFK